MIIHDVQKKVPLYFVAIGIIQREFTFAKKQ